MKNEELILQILKNIQEDQKAFRVETNARFEKIDQRFEKIEQRFEKIEQRFEKSENTMNSFRQEIRSDLKQDRSRLDAIYDSRHQVEYKMTRDFVLKNVGWNAVIIITGILLAEAILT